MKGDFSDGLALVSDDEAGHSRYFIDRSGKRDTHIPVQNATRFSNGLAVVEQNGRQVYVNRSGKVVAAYN